MTKILTAGALAAASMGPLDSVALHLFDVSATTIFMSLAGAILSFAYSEGEETLPASRKRLYFLVAANTFISAAIIAVAPGILGWEWYNNKVEGSMALLLAASARFTIPLFLRTLPELFKELMRKWFGLGEYGSVTKGEGNRSRRNNNDIN